MHLIGNAKVLKVLHLFSKNRIGVSSGVVSGKGEFIVAPAQGQSFVDKTHGPSPQ